MKVNHSRLFQILICLAFVAVNATLLYYHEPWRDEAQSWLIARDLPFIKIPAQMYYEGHPCLWHLLVALPAKLGLPYLSQNILSFLIMTATVLLFVFFAPMSNLFKAVFCLSPACTYFFPVIARNYCLIPLFMVLLALMYPKRFEWRYRYCLVIALLVQTHVVMLATAFFIALMYMIEVLLYIKQKKLPYLYPLVLPAISALLLGFQLFVGPGDRKNTYYAPVAYKDTTTAIISRFFGTDESISLIIAVLLIAVTIFCLVRLINMGVKRDALSEEYTGFFNGLTAFVVIVGSLLFQIWFYSRIYSYMTQRLMVIFLILLWGLWITREGKSDILEQVRAGRIGGVLLFLFAAICLVRTVDIEIRDEYHLPFSNAGVTAAFLNEYVLNESEDAVVLSDNKGLSTAVLPYFKQKALYAKTGEAYSFITWNEFKEQKSFYDAFLKTVDTLRGNHKAIYLLHCPNAEGRLETERLDDEFERIFETNGTALSAEEYILYRIVDER